jgi:hypothetical protein
MTGPISAANMTSEVMYNRVSRSITPAVSLMLSTITTAFSPGQAWRF